MKSLLLVLFLVAPACGPAATPAHSLAPADARTATLSLHKIDCADCAEDVRTEIEKTTKVYDLKFDKRRAVLTLVVDRNVTDDALIAAAKRKGITATAGDAGGSYVPDVVGPLGADVVTVVTDGSDYPDLARATVAGKITIVDFYAEWCMPCRAVDEHVKKRMVDRKDLAYRRFNVVDWDTPLAKRHLHGVPQLPFVVVYDGKGARVEAISGADLVKLDAAVARAKP